MAKRVSIKDKNITVYGITGTRQIGLDIKTPTSLTQSRMIGMLQQKVEKLHIAHLKEMTSFINNEIKIK